MSSNSDKVIRFPGSQPKPGSTAQAPQSQKPTAASDLPGEDGLTDDQRKAIQLVLSGLSFVLVAMKPTDRGSDFFTAVHGDAGELRNAQPHLDGVIARAYGRKGL
jgi:hypothetical protein